MALRVRGPRERPYATASDRGEETGPPPGRVIGAAQAASIDGRSAPDSGMRHARAPERRLTMEVRGWRIEVCSRFLPALRGIAPRGSRPAKDGAGGV